MMYLDKPQRTFEEAFRDVVNSPDWNARPLVTQMRIAKEAARREQRKEPS